MSTTHHVLSVDSKPDELDELAEFLGVSLVDLPCCDIRDIHGKRIGRVQSIVLETAVAVVILTTPDKATTEHFTPETIVTANGPAEATVNLTGCTLNFFRPGEPSDAKPHTVITLPVTQPQVSRVSS